jgi:two-component system LytT family response regulator
MNINAILIDDEPKALAILKNKIELFCSNANVIRENQNPDEAIEMIKKNLMI